MTRANRLSILSRIKTDDDRFGFAVAVVGHALVLALFAINPDVTEPPPLLSEALTVDIVDGSDAPMFGDPKGDDAPPPAVETDQPELTKETAPEKLSVREALQELKEEQSLAQVSPPVSTPRSSPTTPSDRTGTGRIAFGAQIHGLGGGMDGDLAAAIAQSVATQISACWEAPRDNAPDNLTITMVVDFDPSGKLVAKPRITRLVDEQEVPVEDPSDFERSAIEAAQRCNPIRLPAPLYRYWRRVHVQIFSNEIPEQTAQRSVQTTGDQFTTIGL